MARKKAAVAAEITPEAPAPDIFDEQIAARQAEAKQAATAIVQQVADSTRVPEQSFAEKVGKKQYKPAPDPFGVEFIAGEGNRVRLLKSTADKAWVIRFEKNPNEMLDPDGVPYSKERPHPVLAYLKSEGYRWGFDQNDGNGGWGKPWQEGHYTYAEHMDSRKVLAKAAEMIGAQVEQGAAVG